MMMRLGPFVFAIAAGPLLFACSPAVKVDTPAEGASAAAPAEPIKGLPENDTCDATRHAKMIGHPFDIPGMPDASDKLRWIHPDTQVTMDFRPDRLNIVVGADGRITELKCG